MTGILINFNSGGASFSLNSYVEDFRCQAQNGAVAAVTRAGTDVFYPDKGTTMLKSAMSGALIDMNAANHVSNFAALAVQAFLQAYDYPDIGEDAVADVTFYPATLGPTGLILQASFTSVGGTILGTTTTT